MIGVTTHKRLKNKKTVGAIFLYQERRMQA